MRLSISDVLAQLRAEGLAPSGIEDAASAALAADRSEELPWFMRTAMGVGAWLATAFLLTGLLTVGGLENEHARIVVGIVFVAAAIWLRRDADVEFLRQAAVAVSFAGQGLVLAGIGELSESATVTGLSLTAISVALIRLMPDQVHRFLSTLVGVGAAAVAAYDARGLSIDFVTLIVVVATALVWRFGLGARSERAATIAEPVGYGLVVALFGLLLYSSFTTVESARWLWGSHFPDVSSRLTTVGITLALLGLVWSIVREQGTAPSSTTAFAALAGVAVLGASTLSSPGIIAGAAVLVLAFDRRNRVLLGLAIVFLLVFGSVYYYSLHLTLLEKSGVLAGSGALLLGIRQRIAPDHGKHEE